MFISGMMYSNNFVKGKILNSIVCIQNTTNDNLPYHAIFLEIFGNSFSKYWLKK